MGNESPTVVVAQLNDEELRKSIDSLVSYFNTQFGEMVKTANKNVGEIETALKRLGEFKLDNKTTVDNGNTARAKANQTEKQSVADLQNEYYRLLGALQMATRQSPLLQEKWKKSLSTEDLIEYGNNLKRISELQKSLDSMRGKMALESAIGAEKKSGFDAKSTIKDLTEVDDRLKQLNKWYAGMEKKPDLVPKEYSLEIKNMSQELSTLRTRLQTTKDEYTRLGQQIENNSKNFIAARDLIIMYKQALRGYRGEIEYYEYKQKYKPQDLTQFDKSAYDTAKIKVREVQEELQKLMSERFKIPTPSKEDTAKYEAMRLEISKLEEEISKYESKMSGIKTSNSNTVDLGTKQLSASREELDAQQKKYDLQNEINRQKEIEAAKTKENIEFEKMLNSIRNGSGSGGSTRRAQETNELRGAIAGLLGVEEKEIQTVDVQSASYKQLSAYLSQLKSAYQRLDQEGMNASHGKMLADEYQRVNKALHDMQSTMTRPTSLEKVLGFEPKTLDDMAYKMQQLKLYKQGIDLTKPGATDEINKVDDALKRLQNDLDKYLGKNKQIQDVNNALSRSWNYMKNRLAFYFTVGASTQFIKQLIEIRGQYEMLERSIGVLADSAQRGSEMFAQLNAMALNSPFTTIELGNAAKQLMAYDVAAKDVVDTTRRLADISAATGSSIERLAYALGHVQTYGYLNSLQARQFTNSGVPIVRELSKMYTELEGKMVSVSDVYDRMKKKAVGYADVQAVITRMTDESGRFFDYQAKTADTLRVQLANLNLAWNNMLNDIGKSNQGVLSAGIKLLRQMLLEWKDVDKAIWTVIITIGVAKSAHLAYYTMVRTTSKAIALESVLGTKLATSIKGVSTAMKGLSASTGWIAAAVAALAVLVEMFVEAAMHADNMRDLNKSITDGAKETTESIRELADSEAMVLARAKAVNKQLSKEDGEKVWKEIREEIELSAKVSDLWIQELLNIPDVNERVEKSFAYLEDIRKAGELMSDWRNNFDVREDKLWGALGEGLAEDIQDFTEAYEKIMKIRGENDFDLFDFGFVKSAAEDAEEEIEQFVKDNAPKLSKMLGDSIGNPVVIQEAVQRLVSAVEEHNPKITGAGKELFETYVYELFGKEFKAFDPMQIQFKKVLDKMKNDSSATFQDIDERILDETKDIPPAYNDAFMRALEDLKKDAPPKVQEILDTLKSQVESQQINIRLGFAQAFNLKELDALEKDYRERFGMFDDDKGKKSEMTGRFMDLYRKEGEDNVKWGERLGEVIDKNKKIAEEAEHAINELNNEGADFYDVRRTDAKRREEDAKQAIEDAKAVMEYEHLSAKEKKEREKGAKKDPLGDALTKEVQLISDMQKRYKEYRKMGVDSQDAIAKATSEYGKTLENTNKKLAQFGLKTLTPKQLATMPLQDVRDFYKEQLNNARMSEKGVEALEKAIASINVEITKIDYKKITDGLNNELSKIKDEYELAVELDADPELGDMFSQMFGIDTDALPQTFGEAFDKANETAKKKLEEMKVDVDDFDLMSTLLEGDEKGEWKGIDVESEFMKDLIKWQETFRDMFKKNLTDTEKMLDDYVKKYGNYSDKIAEIESDRLEKIAQLNNAYYNEEMRRRPEYSAKMNAIEQGARSEKGNARFDEFKNSRLYVQMFENLRYVSTATLETMKTKLNDLQGEMGKLKPEQVKEIAQQFEKIESEMIRRNPFKNATKNAKEYLKAIGKAGKQAEENFITAQQNYDAQLNLVATLKEQLESAKRQGESGKAQVELLNAEIEIEDDKLKMLREELELAGQINQQYDLTRKLFTEQAKAMISLITSNVSSLSELRDTLWSFGINLGDDMDAVIDDLSTASDGVNKVVSSLESGNVVGAVSGVVKTVGGIGDAIASVFGDGAARTKRINREINRSKESVRQLEMAYKDLQRTVERATGAEETRARREQIANKEAELAEIERQKALEESKRAKDRDEGVIKQYEETAQDLRMEIDDLKKDVVDNLLGEDVKSAAEEFVDAWVQAWRAGETTLDAIDKKMDEVVFNLIKKAATSRIVSNLLNPLYETVDAFSKEGSEGGVDFTTGELAALAALSKELGVKINDALGAFYGNLANLGIIAQSIEDNKELSALQQGIQGITEDTAGALEAYMNSVSQQVYLHSDLLTQIRDVIVTLDFDMQTSVMSQMLLQLQSSYQVQMSIQNILLGVLNPSGMAMRVELAS